MGSVEQRLLDEMRAKLGDEEYKRRLVVAEQLNMAMLNDMPNWLAIAARLSDGDEGNPCVLRLFAAAMVTYAAQVLLEGGKDNFLAMCADAFDVCQEHAAEKKNAVQ